MTDKIKITKEKLENFISDSSVELDLAEVEALMDAEVEKPEAEMDTELVDMCAAILAKAYNPGFEEGKPAQMYRPWEDEKSPAAESTTETKPGKKKTISFKRILLVAAAVSLVVVAFFALPAGAKLFDNGASDGIIEFYSDFFKINLNEDEPTVASENDAVSEMIINSLDTFMLPEVLLSDEYEKTARLEQKDYLDIFYINVANIEKGISGSIVITQYNDDTIDMTNGFGNVSDKHRNYKELTIEGKKIIVFGMGEKSYINYSDSLTNYQIALICDFDTMVSIAETINVKG